MLAVKRFIHVKTLYFHYKKQRERGTKIVPRSLVLIIFRSDFTE